MDSEPNDFIVNLLTGIVNLLHILAAIALVVANYYAYHNIPIEMIDTGLLIAYQIIFSMAALVVYVIAVGTLSLLISINRNLKILVLLQSSQANKTTLK